ncbi:T7SS effector LXG polymorphic toxin [Cytobacillus horneckiae]|uniref:T7SS effector LXG polymorphic toxin n=1 Tax=Cytobacillus horneckiae TaxID=549687 RepID=UPI003D9A7214
MKVLDANDLHNSIQQLASTLKLFKKQIHQVQLDVRGIVSLEDALKGQGGQAIQLFYQECHLPFLVFLEEWINEYESTLNKMSQSLQTLEPSPSGVIRQPFLENELVQGIRRVKMNTMELTSETNSIIQSVQEIASLPLLNEGMFVRDTRLAQDKSVETIEKLQAFDQRETASLEPLQQELHKMNQYIEQMASMFKNEEFNLTQYKPEVLTWQKSYDKLSNKNTDIHTEQNTLQDIAEGVIEGASNAVSDVWEGLKSTIKLGQNILTLTNPMFLGSEILFNRGENLLENYRFINRMIQDPKASIQQVIDMPKYIWAGIKEAWERDVINGDVKSRSAFFSYGLTSLGIGLLGDKGISKAGTIFKTVDKAAKGIKNIPSTINTPTPVMTGAMSQPSIPYNVINNPLTQIKMSTEKVYGVKGNTVSDYLDDIVEAGNVNATKMNKLKNAIQNITFSVDELSEISKKMSELRITKEYNEALIKIDFGKYLRGLIGDPPTAMIDPHAHHILFKKGLGETQQKLVLEGQELLRKYGIDPIISKENLVWAPNRVAGQHSIAALENVVNQLKAVDAAGADLDDIIEILEDLGKQAASRK